MNKIYIPENYKPVLDAYDTQRAIAYIKETFQQEFSKALNLKRVSAPLFVTESSGLNDNLNGYERPVAFDIPAVGMDAQTEKLTDALVALSRSAAPGCLIAGDLTTLAVYCDSWNPDCFDLLVENYRRQIRGLIDGGADLLIGETLLYAQEAEAILTAAELEGAGAAMYSFTLQSDGALLSGADGGKVLHDLEAAGAAAVGFNCVAADMMTPHLVSKLRRSVKVPLICKPNAGIPTINDQGVAEYAQTPEEFTEIMLQCRDNGAALLGGCCGTTPAFIAALAKSL